MTEQDKDWVKEHYEQFQCAHRMDPRWVLANTAPLEFEIPRTELSRNAGGGWSIDEVKDRATGVLLYNKELEEYSGLFPDNGRGCVPCVNGHDFDEHKEEHRDGRSLYPKVGPGTCAVVEQP